MEKLRTELQKAYINLKTFLKWVGISCLIGCIVGAAGILFHLGLTLATNLRTEHPFLLFALPFGGLLIVLLYKLCGMEKDRGTNFVLVAVRSNEKLSFKTAPLIFISTIITHLLGGSAGREGAALQLGGSIAAKIGDIFKPDDKDKRIITMCGMSAAFSAVFGTPVTAAIFSLEVVSVGVMYYAALVPCILSSVIGYSLARLVNIQPTKFTIPFVPDLSFSVTLKVIITAGLCAVLSILFCLILKKTAVLYEKLTGNAYIRVFAGGCVIIALSLIFGTGKYNGAGMPAIEQAINGSASPEAFALKIIFTALTLGAGYKGGEIVPTFFIGATFGAAPIRFWVFLPASVPLWGLSAFSAV